MSGVQSLAGILLISAKQKCLKEYFVLNHLYEIGLWYLLNFRPGISFLKGQGHFNFAKGTSIGKS